MEEGWYNSSNKLSNEEFLDRRSYSSDDDKVNEKDRVLDDWQQSEYLDNFGYNLD